MNKLKKKTLTISFLLASFITFSQVGIGTDTPNVFSALDITSSDKGLLLPRMSTADRTDINPSEDAFGLQVYDTDTKSIWFFNGSQWYELGIKGDGTGTGDGTGDGTGVDGSNTAQMVVRDCDQVGFKGSYVNDLIFNAKNVFTITVTNNSFATAVFDPDITDVVLTGSGLGNVYVSSVSPASFNLGWGKTREISYRFTGTPTTGEINLDWSLHTLSCTRTKNVGEFGDATFTNDRSNSYIFSVNDATAQINTQGTFISGTKIDVPYTSATGSYSAHTEFTAIDPQYAEDGGPDWTFGYSYEAGTYDSSGEGVIEVTLYTQDNGVNTDFPAKRVDNIELINFNFVSLPFIVDGLTQSNTIGLDEGGDAIFGSLTTNSDAYVLAESNTPVKITYAEYQNMLITIPDAEIFGYQGDVTVLASTHGGSDGISSSTGSQFKSLPDNCYVAGVARAQTTKTNAFIITVTDDDGTSNVMCLTDIGPPVYYPGATYNYFAIKKPNRNSGTGKTFLGDSKTGALTVRHNGSGFSGSTRYGTTACSSDGYASNGTSAYCAALQVIGSTQKSW